MNLLIDQPWNGIAAIAAIISLLIGIVNQRDKVQSLITRIFVVAISVVGGIVLMSFGPLLQSISASLFESEFSSTLESLNDAIGTQGLEIITEGILFGLFPGAVTVVAALSGSNRKQRIRRSVITAVVSLILYDILSFAISGWERGVFRIDIFAIISDLFGGAIAGYLIGLFIGLILRSFDAR